MQIEYLQENREFEIINVDYSVNNLESNNNIKRKSVETLLLNKQEILLLLDYLKELNDSFNYLFDEDELEYHSYFLNEDFEIFSMTEEKNLLIINYKLIKRYI